MRLNGELRRKCGASIDYSHRVEKLLQRRAGMRSIIKRDERHRRCFCAAYELAKNCRAKTRSKSDDVVALDGVLVMITFSRGRKSNACVLQQLGLPS
jgi:hypothetical protein